ncbi:MAG: MCE family protein [Desulfobulbus sp.]|nr:MAG: MCE family protein [Desulfobulbus sp.]
MSRHANPALIGGFVLGALALAVTVVMLLAGGQWFQKKYQHILYFDEAAEGLQVGAPVVFLGVKVGTVKDIRLGLGQEGQRFMVPVIIELESHPVMTPAGERINLQDRSTIQDLIERGLRARLKVKSLLTGQRFVDLDFHPDKAARFVGTDAGQSEIPTIPTTVEELTTMLEGFPMDKFLSDISSINNSLKTLLGSEATKRIPGQLSSVLGHLESLSARLDKESEPLVAEVRTNLNELGQAVLSVRQAMDRVGEAADRVSAIAAPDSPLAAGIARAGDELAAASVTLHQLADSRSPTVQNLNAAATEIARTARSLRQLAETLEQQPEALLRGKDTGEDRP